MTNAPGYWVIFTRAFAEYDPGKPYWVPTPLADVYVQQCYAYRMEPQPEKKVMKRDVL